MRKIFATLLVSVFVALLAGCGGGGGGGGGSSVTRVLVGFCYVTGNAGSGSPQAIVTPNSNPPSGYFKPTAGLVTVAVTNGSITRGPDSTTFDMALSNEIICNARQNSSPHVATVSATGLQNLGTPKTAWAPLTVDLGTSADNNTVLGISTPGAPSYTPGAPAQIRMLIRNNNVGSTPGNYAAPDVATGGSWISGNTYLVAIAVMDAEGTAITGATTSITSSDPSLLGVSGSTLSAVSGTGAAAADVQITAAVTNPATSLQEQYTANFNYGTATFVSVALGVNTLEWEEATGGGMVNTTTAVATVTNQHGAPFPATTVNWSNPGKVTGTAWNAPVGGACFSAASGVTGNNGQTPAVTVSTPAPADGPLPLANKFPKGANNITGTAGSATGFSVLTITRPLGSIQISGPSRLDTGTLSALIGSQSYQLLGAQDVDNDSVPAPAITWQVTNQQFATTVGNTGDTTAGTFAASSINSGTGRVTTGGVAGQITVEAVGGAVTSNGVVTQIHGVPAKIIFSPDTQASAIPGARGEYAFGSVGAQQSFGFSLQDSSGHAVPAGEHSGFTSIATIQALTGGSITPGGFNVSSFTITCGNVDGLFTITVNGTWSGAQGGSGPINLSRDTGQNAP